ncbi:hypothetical protein PPERSA_02200 [Pseudocohnilembus persalinus]|uniref:Uncharacterized protein n=1 Tax=Pseudocohnilembus persalinus TaxID=266149 RepID=A0A0V0R0M7_PSEPJ|nr:hypothetical protein PPERSA_02200 [Pseudocohnilembus persalinus]|eukprot:KRX08068.1 hypothetical protein PPERSA_02200 [Pseudocohnilembus persalinus]
MQQNQQQNWLNALCNIFDQSILDEKSKSFFDIEKNFEPPQPVKTITEKSYLDKIFKKIQGSQRINIQKLLLFFEDQKKRTFFKYLRDLEVDIFLAGSGAYYFTLEEKSSNWKPGDLDVFFVFKLLNQQNLKDDLQFNYEFDHLKHDFVRNITNHEFFDQAEKVDETNYFSNYKVETYKYKDQTLNQFFKIQLCFLNQFQIDFKELYTRISLEKVEIYHKNDFVLTTTHQDSINQKQKERIQKYINRGFTIIPNQSVKNTIYSIYAMKKFFEQKNEFFKNKQQRIKHEIGFFQQVFHQGNYLQLIEINQFKELDDLYKRYEQFMSLDYGYQKNILIKLKILEENNPDQEPNNLKQQINIYINFLKNCLENNKKQQFIDLSKQVKLKQKDLDYLSSFFPIIESQQKKQQQQNNDLQQNEKQEEGDEQKEQNNEEQKSQQHHDY